MANSFHSNFSLIFIFFRSFFSFSSIPFRQPLHPLLIQPSTDLPSLLKIRVSRISKISLLHIKLGMQGNPFKNHIQLDRNHLKGEKRGGADYYGENGGGAWLCSAEEEGGVESCKFIGHPARSLWGFYFRYKLLKPLYIYTGFSRDAKNE